MRSAGLCNLSEVVVRAGDSLEDLKRKVEIATIIGTYQAMLTKFRYVRKIWQTNQEEERLLGVSMTGIMEKNVASVQRKKSPLKGAFFPLNSLGFRVDDAVVN